MSTASSLAPVFAALGDPTRLQLVERLSDGEPRSIARLSADGRLTRQAVTKHLVTLERAGLVRRARLGRESRFVAVSGGLEEARAYLHGVAAQWDDALARLQAHLAQDG